MDMKKISKLNLTFKEVELLYMIKDTIVDNIKVIKWTY